MTVKLHVGYVGKTREGKRVEIVSNDGSREGYWPWVGDDRGPRNGDGTFWDDGDPSPRDIIGPWVEPDTQEPGPWIGWNGCECPVHPETVVDVTGHDFDQVSIKASHVDWQSLRGAYRVIKEHKEPREFWLGYNWQAYRDKSAALATFVGSGEEPIHVREVTE